MTSTESVTPMRDVMNGYLILLDRNVNASILKYGADIVMMIAGMTALVLASVSDSGWQTYAGLSVIILASLALRLGASRIVKYTQSELDIAQKGVN